jgi:N-acetylglucosaminyldiphosphoundecaprenol N-acetyl-beta-D-mannosaminyltransferase
VEPARDHSRIRRGENLELKSQATPASNTTYVVLGVPVSAVQIPGVVDRIEEWIARREACRYIAVTGMHGVMLAQHDPGYLGVLSDAAMVVPDGMPLVWAGRRLGFDLPRRVYGPELMETFCARTRSKGYRHFFYGAKPGVADELARRLAERYPGLQVAGVCSPPFRPLTDEEDRSIVRAIEDSKADIVWVGLGAPKQEVWMHQHQGRLSAPVLVGVGAAFDFHAGRVPSAPEWMREHGFEWAFRLALEPRRLWKRYLVYGSEFALRMALEVLRSRGGRPPVDLASRAHPNPTANPSERIPDA